jgi:hypothetical protein
LSEGSDIDDVRVLGMNDDCGDPFRISQTHVLPSLSAVSRLVNAVAEGNAVAGVRFSGPGPDDLRIARSQRNITE